MTKTVEGILRRELNFYENKLSVYDKYDVSKSYSSNGGKVYRNRMVYIMNDVSKSYSLNGGEVYRNGMVDIINDINDCLSLIEQ